MADQLPMYQCIKRVRAAKISGIAASTSSAARTVTTEFGTFDASGSQFDKAETGWWFVQYPDGYTSASPAVAFEDGYVAIQSHTSVSEIQSLRYTALMHAVQCSGIAPGDYVLKAAQQFVDFLKGA